MNKKLKIIRANLVTVALAVTSFMAVTLAWFAYSGLSSMTTEIDVKAWYIELTKDGEAISNQIEISLSDIHPGMDLVSEKMEIKNMGDSDASLKYIVTSARILGNEEDYYEYDEINPNTLYIEDSISHNYPFHINMSFSKNHLLAHGDEGTFTVSISWPLDSNDDEADSLWGNGAYAFQKSEANKKLQDPNYLIQPSIKIVISVIAEQHIKDATSSDLDYPMGKKVLFNPVLNQACSSVGNDCYKTRVIDGDNKKGDLEVNLMLDPSTQYVTSNQTDYASNMQLLASSWTVPYKGLEVGDLLTIVSKDVVNTQIITTGIAPEILGHIYYGDRLNTIINKAKLNNSIFTFNNKPEYLVSNNCYWTNTVYDTTSTFAIKKEDENTSAIYKKNNLESCNIVPVITVEKINL